MNQTRVDGTDTSGNALSEVRSERTQGPTTV